MKKLITLTLIVMVLSLSAMATPTVKFIGMGPNEIYYGLNAYAGEMKFIASGIAGIADGQFTTFCVEGNEHVYQNTTYDAVLNTGAVHGGLTGGDPDYLSNSTAWLYNDYLDNVLGQTFSNTTARNYQVAIWYLEGEITSLDASDGAWALINEANNHLGWTNTTIKVLNLYALGTYGTSNPVYMQDCLVRVVVPVPGAVILGGIGVSLVGWMRRKKSL